jgi:hypothetical protein
MGGGISCQSELGRGSCFIIRVPAMLSRQTVQAEADGEPEPLPPAYPAAASA